MHSSRFGLFQPLNLPITDWRGKRVWIIGASSGIGAALAKDLLDHNAQLILSARRHDALVRIAQNHPNAKVLAFDVAQAEDWQMLGIEHIDLLNQIDLVIFCAAKYQPERCWEVDGNDAQDTLNTNLTSIYRGLQLILPNMLERGHGGVAIIASVAGYLGLPNASVYGPGKAALINLAEILYSDLHPKNLSVYLISPGFVSTPLTEKNSFSMPALQTPEQAAKSIIKGISEGKFEIHFPKRFTLFLKCLQILPYRLRFALIRHFVTGTTE